MKRTFVFLSIITLSACGGGGGDSSSSAFFNPISGVVVDGYIQGAKVCIDLNSNQACDSDEPYSITDAQGAYTLDVSGYDLTRYHLVAVADADTAKDLDDGGLTLSEAGKSTLKLIAPAHMPEVISPATTLIIGKMIENGIGIEQATSSVAAQVGVSNLELISDPIATRNTQLHGKFQTIANHLMRSDLSEVIVNLDSNMIFIASSTAVGQSSGEGSIGVNVTAGNVSGGPTGIGIGPGGLVSGGITSSSASH